MSNLGLNMSGGGDPIRRAVDQLVSAEKWADTVFVRLPFLFPGGTSATVSVARTAKGFLVSDHGFAYRELEAIGAERSFGSAARSFPELDEIEKDSRRFFTICDAEDLSRAIVLVGSASWRLVDKVYADKEDEEDDLILADELQNRLVSLFGPDHVRAGEKLRGVSSTEWPVSAVVDQGEMHAVFQAVSNHPNSIYRTNSAFHDLSAVARPPKLIAVVRSIEELGPRLSILSQAGKVIEENSPAQTFLTAAA